MLGVGPRVRCPPSTRVIVGLVALLAWWLPHAARADDFQQVSFDPSTDEIVIGVIYRGTNPDHQFSLQWDTCQTRGDHQEILGNLLDQQGRDAARTEFRKTLRFSIADLGCRPALATIRTAPRFYATVRLPAARAVP